MGWDGWEVHRGLLFPPGYRRGGITPGDFYALVFLRQLVGAYREDNAALAKRLKHLDAQLARPQGVEP